MLDNFCDTDLSQMYPKGEFPLGDFEKEWQLGTGEKTVSLYFPWSVNAVVREICLDNGSFIVPVKTECKLLSFGDSITHGYDALYPSNKYVSLLADYLNAEEYNKGIGGDMFFPPLASAKEDFSPDYITVAYGTNDWNNCTKEVFVERCSKFFDNLSRTYRNSKIFAISPIWRKDCDSIKKFGKFEDVNEIIKETVLKYENIFFVSGADIMPHDENLLSDGCVHPNDDGFIVYFKNLIKRL